MLYKWENEREPKIKYGASGSLTGNYFQAEKDRAIYGEPLQLLGWLLGAMLNGDSSIGLTNGLFYSPERDKQNSKEDQKNRDIGLIPRPR